jgi:RimJ/RimL family protein N-acetyltransferase
MTVMIRPRTTLPDRPAPVETPRLSLRRLRMRDAEAVRALTDHPAVLNAVSFLARPFGIEAARTLLGAAQDGTNAFMGIWERSSGRLAGVVGLHLRGVEAIEIGYWLGVEYHRRGYATEAAGAIVARFERVLPGRRFIAECRPENEASWRVLTKLGFRDTGEPGVRPGRKLLARDVPDLDEMAAPVG